MHGNVMAEIVKENSISTKTQRSEDIQRLLGYYSGRVEHKETLTLVRHLQ